MSQSPWKTGQVPAPGEFRLPRGVYFAPYTVDGWRVLVAVNSAGDRVGETALSAIVDERVARAQLERVLAEADPLAPPSARGIYRLHEQVGGSAAYFAKDRLGQIVRGIRVVGIEEEEATVITELKHLLDEHDPRPRLELVR